MYVKILDNIFIKLNCFVKTKYKYNDSVQSFNHIFIVLNPNTVFCCIHAIREKNELNAIADTHIIEEQAWELLSNAPLTKD